MDRVKKQIHYWCRDIRVLGYLGQNITVAILDTGMYPHPDLQGRVLAFQDCVNGKQQMYDDSGHGTHVAGILAGNGKVSKGILSGMAPKARLAVIKVLDGKGDGKIQQLLDGVEWIRRNSRRYNIRIVNLSAGTRGGRDLIKEAMLLKAVEELWDMGLAVIVSAGNLGPGEGSVTIPGTSRKVITVGALHAGKKEDTCSGRGPTEACVVKPDILAPGYQILSCNAMHPGRSMAYTVKSGTSMATPIISGAVAVLLSKYPDMGNVELKLRLHRNSDQSGDIRMLNMKKLMQMEW